MTHLRLRDAFRYCWSGPAVCLAFLILSSSGIGVAAEPELDRTELPIRAPWRPPITTLDARDAKAPPLFKVTAPDNAPNVVIILVDDLGFGGTSACGGVIPTPTFDRMARQGLLYNQFHSTALCSPSRQALKTGRNHHSCNQAKITEVATAFPGATGQLPNDVATIGEMLRLNGYSTGAFGKWHETAVWEISPSGPMTRWPNQVGFDEFYGFMGGETNQWAPSIYHNQNPIDPPDDPDYHFMNDMTTKAINWMRFQQSLTPEKPFMMYFAPGAVHAPHHVPKKYIEQFAGQFDEGWDVIRERIYKKQLELGVIPEGTKLADKPDAIKDWDSLSEKEQKLFARQAETFAGFLHMTDLEIGRLVDAIDQMGELDNTLIFYIAGDNGTSAEGGENGLYNELTYFNEEPKGSNVDFMLQHYDEWGSPSTYPHMAAGWAVCFDAPFMWTKQVASNYGGTRQGLAVHWPNGIKAQGELRTQWHHLIDVVPTILEAAKLPQPRVVNGVPQRPIEGVSMLYSFDDAEAADRHTIQYFEMFGNRGLYYDGWFAGTIHVAPWARPTTSFEDDTWELYHVAEDFSMSTDLADKHPGKLKELQELFLAEAVKYKVLPLDDRRTELFDPKRAGRPDLMFGRKTLTLYEGMGALLENDFINVKNTSFEIVSEIETSGEKTQGVIVQQAGRFGGWSLYVKDGKPTFAYNYLGLETFVARADTPLPEGKATVTLTFDYDGGKPGSGGTATLSVNGKKADSVRVEKTEPNAFSADETANVGLDRETPVVEDYATRNGRFTGTIDKVTIELK
ncbi:Arylsulfatase [Maioricimonas rarisocia]|uniref:Arylsulfatase n=1 Tax=Maioricimonas rarisocia TaxID=2528026 RepID=A0A517Z4V9_9PLAN|nr:arylsulfatase [Maioricimonas rarisocia]QDU37495.1 Arylsulfatase [Maioricimonas rarisocia]